MPFHRRHTFPKLGIQKAKTVEDANKMIASLTIALNDTHSKMNEVLTDIERSAGGSGVTNILIASGSGGGSGGSGATIPQIAVGSMAILANTNNVVPLGRIFTSTFELIVWCYTDANRYSVGVDIPTASITSSSFVANPLRDATIVWIAISK